MGLTDYMEELKKDHEIFQKETNVCFLLMTKQDKNKFKNKISNEEELARLKEKQKHDLEELAINYAQSNHFPKCYKFLDNQDYRTHSFCENKEIDIENEDDEEDYENFD